MSAGNAEIVQKVKEKWFEFVFRIFFEYLIMIFPAKISLKKIKKTTTNSFATMIMLSTRYWV